MARDLESTRRRSVGRIGREKTIESQKNGESGLRCVQIDLYQSRQACAKTNSRPYVFPKCHIPKHHNDKMQNVATHTQNTNAGKEKKKLLLFQDATSRNTKKNKYTITL